MIDNTKTLICFSSNYYPNNVYLKLSPECLNLIKFLKEKDILNSDWEFENIEEIEVHEF